jgi:hypothetical protein
MSSVQPRLWSAGSMSLALVSASDKGIVGRLYARGLAVSRLRRRASCSARGSTSCYYAPATAGRHHEREGMQCRAGRCALRGAGAPTRGWANAIRPYGDVGFRNNSESGTPKLPNKLRRTGRCAPLVVRLRCATLPPRRARAMSGKGCGAVWGGVPSGVRGVQVGPGRCQRAGGVPGQVLRVSG